MLFNDLFEAKSCVVGAEDDAFVSGHNCMIAKASRSRKNMEKRLPISTYYYILLNPSNEGFEAYF